MPAPYALQPMVDRWRKDWSFMSGLWRERGEHTDAELEQLARDILESMVSTDPPFPDIDDRAQRRHEGRGASLEFGGDGFQNADGAARHRRRLQADLCDQIHEGRRRTIDDRHFRTIDLDQRVIDTQRSKSRHQVFDGRDRHTGFIGDRGAETDGGDVGGPGLDAVLCGVEIGPLEHDAGARRRGFQNQTHALAGMETNPGTHRRRCQSLPVHTQHTAREPQKFRKSHSRIEAP